MDKFIQQLGIVSIERRPEACLGCGFEHGCSTHGCAVIKTASEQLKAYRATNHTPEECAAAFEELAAYHAAEQDGTLLRLPCKVGDDCFSFDWDIKKEEYKIVRSKVKSVRYDSCDGTFCISNGDIYGVLGKRIFLVEEAAEAALKEQKWQK